MLFGNLHNYKACVFIPAKYTVMYDVISIMCMV